MDEQGRKWLEQQLPGLEDQPLWVDLGLIISVPLHNRPGLTNVITVRRLDHLNYLNFHGRSCTLDTNTGIPIEDLPGALDDEIAEYQGKVFGYIHPFI